MDKGVKRIFIGYGSAIAVLIILINIASVSRSDDKEKKVQQNAANTELVKQEIVDPEKIDFDNVKIQKEDTPQDLKDVSYLLVRRTQKKGGLGEPVWEYETSDSSLGDLKDKTWTKEELSDLGVIVVAASNYEKESYSGVYAGNSPTTITSEGIDIYYINTKTKTVFQKDVIERKEFPKSISGSAHNLTISESDLNDRIENTIRGESTEKGMSDWTKVLLVVGGIIGGILLIYFIFSIYLKIRYKV